MSRTITEHKSFSLSTPLAASLRPKTFAEVVGHEDIIGQGTVLRKVMESGQIGSLILWGPPGIGKTTIAYLMANQMDAATERISAVTAGVKDLRQVIERALEWKKVNKRTVLIVDEIHRFNKAQQDVLLPVVEDGLITLIGATTENPYFEVIKALVSRAEVIKLDSLQDEDIEKIVKNAVKKLTLSINPQALAALINFTGGDARRALNILERAASALPQNRKSISLLEVEAAAQKSVIQYDKGGDAHYDTISAFIKSMRGSDADAALFYLFRMLHAGEDPKFIIRRMLIFASEDIGNADPHALMLTSSAARTLEWVGLPEAEYALAHAAVYLSAAPKSNTIKIAMEKAKLDVINHGNAVPPAHITNAPITELKKHGKGVGYKYPHDYPNSVVAQQYRPTVIDKNIYYEPKDEGFEQQIKKRIDAARKKLQTYPNKKSSA